MADHGVAMPRTRPGLLLRRQGIVVDALFYFPRLAQRLEFLAMDETGLIFMPRETTLNSAFQEVMAKPDAELVGVATGRDGIGKQ